MLCNHVCPQHHKWQKANAGQCATISYLQAFLVSVVDDNPDFLQRCWWVGLQEPVHCPQHGLCHYVMGVSQVSSPQGWQSHSRIATLTGQIQTLGHNHLQWLSTTIKNIYFGWKAARLHLAQWNCSMQTVQIITNLHWDDLLQWTRH